MKSRLLLQAIAGVVLCYPATAQLLNPEPSEVIESLIESMSNSSESSADFEAILSELEYLHKNPIDLNYADNDDFRKLPFLTDFQINNLLAYRKENGNFLSIYELQLINGYTEEVIRMILPYVVVSDKRPVEGFKLNNLVSRGNHELAFRTQRVLEHIAGYTRYDSISGTYRYPGNPWLYYARYGYNNAKHLRAGITLEKDPGETFFSGHNRHGFDFNSAYLMIQKIGPIESILVGDFRLQFGQGLTLWNGAAPGKSSLPLNILKRQDAVKAFSSTNENIFFRGIAANVKLGKFVITGFYSSKKRDANITDTLAPDRINFSSFQESGYHRTTAETADEKSVLEMATGCNIVYRHNLFKIGTTCVYYHLNKFMEKGDDIKDIHDFSGNDLFNWGIDYSLALNKVQLFGETSYGNHSWATLHGALFNVNKYASFSLLYRNFSSGYYSMHSEALSEGSDDSNEEAFYAGIVIHPFRFWKISAYADFYRFPWLKYRVSAPSHGSDYHFQIDYSPIKSVRMLLRYRFEANPENDLPDSMLIPVISSLHYSGLRYHISYRLSDRLLLQNRIELVKVKHAKVSLDRGYLIYQDIEYRFGARPMILDFRWAFFKTDSYDSRIYAFEQDMIQGFSFSPLYDKGFRTYLMWRYDPFNKLSLRIRISQTNFLDKSVIGSGYDKINNNTRTEIKLQIIKKF
jgi:hypothetical protein